jgi:glycosyltransferase involved in cell wall biosynthesis
MRLLKDDEFRRRLASNGLEYVVNHRSWEAVAREVEATIREVVRK